MSFFSNINFSSLNFTIDDFEHPNLQLIERYFVPIEFGFTTIAFALFVWVAVTQTPKPMKRYSVLLIYQVCTTYVFDMLIVICQPVLLLPYPAAYINGFWQFGERGNCIAFLLFCLNVTTLVHGFLAQILFRLASLYDSNQRFYKYTSLRHLFTVMFPILLLFLGVITRKFLFRGFSRIQDSLYFIQISPFFSVGFSMDRPEGELFRETLIAEYPFFEELFQRRKFAMGYHPSFSSGINGVFGLFVGFAAICIPLNIFIAIAFYKRLNYVKNTLNEKNRVLHVMLLK